MKCISYVKFDVDVGIVVDVDIDVGVTVDSNFYDPIHFVVKFDIYVATLRPVHVKAILG